MRARLLLVLLPVAQAAEWPPRPQLTQLQKRQLQGVSAALLTRSVLGEARRAASKPPLRLELGQQEEASLVDSEPPGPWQLFTRAIVLLLVFLPTVLTAILALTGALLMGEDPELRWKHWRPGQLVVPLLHKSMTSLNLFRS